MKVKLFNTILKPEKKIVGLSTFRKLFDENKPVSIFVDYRMEPILNIEYKEDGSIKYTGVENGISPNVDDFYFKIQNFGFDDFYFEVLPSK